MARAVQQIADCDEPSGQYAPGKTDDFVEGLTRRLVFGAVCDSRQGREWMLLRCRAVWPASAQIAAFGVAFWREKGHYPAGARPLIWLALLHPLRCGFWLAALSLSITYVWRSLICVFLSV